ncbi:Guanylate kinase [Candidatus Hartigia pinicola]|nr:Guanylate kinase [Candidatus Hartigia pinicola]
MIQGTLYIISAPSGTGKSSLIKELFKKKLLYDIQVSISYTTRSARQGEVNGIHYFFISKTDFLEMADNNEFLEYACVFGNYYGTSRIMIENILKNGVDILLDIDWQGAQQIRKVMPIVCSIFILPPSKDELYLRLCGRGQDSSIVIEKRMSQALSEIEHYNEYDHLIINDDFNTALSDFQSILRSGRLRLCRQIQQYDSLIRKLLAD